MSLEKFNVVQKDEAMVRDLSDDDLDKLIRQCSQILKEGPAILKKGGDSVEEIRRKIAPWGYSYELALAERERREALKTREKGK
jgi:hypothetical protein